MVDMRIGRIVLAVERMDAMIAFYDRVFGTDLRADPGSPFHRGTLAGIPLLFCPNELAGVVAEANRHQLRLVVDDLDGVLATVVPAGGRIVNGEGGDRQRVVGIADPDGNTYELVGAGDE